VQTAHKPSSYVYDPASIDVPNPAVQG
jgi:hypothetical protein